MTKDEISSKEIQVVLNSLSVDVATAEARDDIGDAERNLLHIAWECLGRAKVAAISRQKYDYFQRLAENYDRDLREAVAKLSVGDRVRDWHGNEGVITTISNGLVHAEGIKPNPISALSVRKVEVAT